MEQVENDERPSQGFAEKALKVMARPALVKLPTRNMTQGRQTSESFPRTGANQAFERHGDVVERVKKQLLSCCKEGLSALAIGKRGPHTGKLLALNGARK